MLEGGLTEYWRNKHWPVNKKCKDSDFEEKQSSLDIYDLQSAFALVILGSVLATLCFIAESLLFVNAS